MPVKNLHDLASRACIKNIKYLDSVGDFLPYEKVQHVLARVEDAEQLRRIEVNSPQIQGRAAELWLKLIEKDFPLELRTKAYKTDDPRKWYKVYRTYKKMHDEKEAEAQRQLRAAMSGLKDEKNKVKVQLVTWKQLPKVPGKGGLKKPSASSSMAFTAGSRTKVNNGRSVMMKARREAKDHANITGSLSRNIGAPRAQSQIKRAPQGMIDAHRRAALPGVRKVEDSEPKVPKVSEAVKAHEDRATFITDSEDDGDLFDESDEAPRPRKVKPFASSASEVSPSKPKTRPPSAAASLLKTRPKTAPSSRPVKHSQPLRKETRDRPEASGSLSQKTKQPTSKSSTKEAASPPPRSSKSTASLSSPEKTKTREPKAQVQTSSRLKEASTPPSTSKLKSWSSDQEKTKLPESESSAKETKTSQPPPRPLKRKAPSMFMKPNKR